MAANAALRPTPAAVPYALLSRLAVIDDCRIDGNRSCFTKSEWPADLTEFARNESRAATEAEWAILRGHRHEDRRRPLLALETDGDEKLVETLRDLRTPTCRIGFVNIPLR